MAGRLHCHGAMQASRVLPLVALSSLVASCKEAPLTESPPHANEGCEHDVDIGPDELPAPDHGAIDDVSVAVFDRPSRVDVVGDPRLPVEAKLLVIAADGTEAELRAIKSVLQHRGVPFDVLVASTETLTSSRLQSSST